VTCAAIHFDSFNLEDLHRGGAYEHVSAAFSLRIADVALSGRDPSAGSPKKLMIGPTKRY
jgi:hypothetical protein